MITLALLRADNTIVPLFLHIAGAMVLVGALTLSAASLVAAWRNGSAALTRLGYMSLFYGALPGYIVFRIGAEWIADKEGYSDSNLTWIGIGYGVSDIGFLLLIVSLVIGGIGVRRINRGDKASATSARIVAGLVSLVLLAYLVAVWAMTTKPV
jgi:hypothetical protein